jgi:protein-L-isoaspartate(D-aspartate) O-methyltransferase
LQPIVEHVQDRKSLAERVAQHTGIQNPAILRAFERVPRHRFVRGSEVRHAHEDRALPIGSGQTISQPSMIALMLDALELEPWHRVLEVGAGSGYAAALLGEIVGQVDAIEIVEELAERAKRTLGALGIENIRIHVGNGALGLPDFAPYDRILVSAGAEAVPQPLLDQLGVNGRIAIPVGSGPEQWLRVGRRIAPGKFVWETRTACVFVPLVTH